MVKKHKKYKKAINILNDPSKKLCIPIEEIMIEKEIKIQSHPNPTHVIVTVLSEPRKIKLAEEKMLKKMLVADVIKGKTKMLTPQEIEVLREEPNIEVEEQDVFKPMVNLAKKLIKPFSKK